MLPSPQRHLVYRAFTFLNLLQMIRSSRPAPTSQLLSIWRICLLATFPTTASSAMTELPVPSSVISLLPPLGDSLAQRITHSVRMGISTLAASIQAALNDTTALQGSILTTSFQPEVAAASNPMRQFSDPIATCMFPVDTYQAPAWEVTLRNSTVSPGLLWKSLYRI